MPLVLVVAAVNGRHSDRTVNRRSCGPLAARLCVESECLWLFCCAVFLRRRKGAVAIGRHARQGAQLSERLSHKFIETSSSSDCDDNQSEPPSLMSAASMFLQPSPTTKRLARLWSEEDGKAEKGGKKRKGEGREKWRSGSREQRGEIDAKRPLFKSPQPFEKLVGISTR